MDAVFDAYVERFFSKFAVSVFPKGFQFLFPRDVRVRVVVKDWTPGDAFTVPRRDDGEFGHGGEGVSRARDGRAREGARRRVSE